MSNFSCSLSRNITSHSMENLTLHCLLRWKMIIITNSHYLTYTFLIKKVGRMYVWNLGVNNCQVERERTSSWTAFGPLSASFERCLLLHIDVRLNWLSCHLAVRDCWWAVLRERGPPRAQEALRLQNWQACAKVQKDRGLRGKAFKLSMNISRDGRLIHVGFRNYSIGSNSWSPHE